MIGAVVVLLLVAGIAGLWSRESNPDGRLEELADSIGDVAENDAPVDGGSNSAEAKQDGSAQVARPESDVPVDSVEPFTDVVVPEGVTPPASSGTAIKVKRVIDGDTIELFTDETVRILGYDTPERGECGFTKATESLQALLLSGNVTMTTDDGDDTDRYDRILRHILVDGTPVGLTLIKAGEANARYDSLDGYPRHRYQNDYRNADGPNTFNCASPATPPPAMQAPAANNGPFANCSEVRAAGRAPILAGEPGFESKFDRDDDGVGCE